MGSGFPRISGSGECSFWTRVTLRLSLSHSLEGVPQGLKGGAQLQDGILWNIGVAEITSEAWQGSEVARRWVAAEPLAGHRAL